MTVTSTHTLDVGGARLHYEVRGSGPLLLCVPGAAWDGGVFGVVAPLLADDYTVVTYDPRGMSRSSVDDPSQDVSVEDQAEDAHRLLKAFGSEPAHVVGNSAGAITGLSLVARHPEQVRTLIAHEPPILELLHDRAERRAMADRVHDTYRKQGPGAAMGMFLELGGFDDSPDAGGESDPVVLEAMARIEDNLDLFFSRVFRSMTAYQPDHDALRAASTRIVVAAGTTSSRGETARRGASALADQLGTELVETPGDHLGFVNEPEAFAEAIRKVLAEAACRQPRQTRYSGSPT